MAHIIDGPNQEFASRLLDLRRKKKCTQEELAQAIGVDKRSISMYENGRTFPREDTIKRLAQELETDPEWLATGETEEIRNYLAEQNANANANTHNLIERVEHLYIENWDEFGDKPDLIRKITYSDSPKYSGHCSDLNKFVPVIKTAFQQYRAVEYPGVLPLNSTYPPGTIVIFDSGKSTLERIPSGSDIIYRLRGKENTPGLRKLLKEPGTQPILIPVDSSYCIQPIDANNVNIEILGIVKSAIISK